jgi:hypothetical protein
MARSRRGFAILACLGAATLAVGISAASGAKLKAESASVTVPVDELGTVAAQCTKGTKAVSGGFESEFDSESTITSPFLEVNESRRDGRRRWETSAFNGGASAGDLTSFAYCRDQKLTRATDTVVAPVGDFVTATAKCPGGTKVISGGFEGSPIDTVGTTPVLYISESRRASKRTWEVSAHSNGNEDGDLTAMAYCGKGKKPKAKSASQRISSDPPDPQTAELLVRCKRNQRVVSGGFGSPDDSGESTPRVMTSMRVGQRGWAVTAFLGSNGLPTEVTAYAYCEKKKA